MRVAIAVDGAERAQEVLQQTAAALSQPVRPLLETLGAEMQTAFQRHIQNAEGPSGPWPKLRPQTVAIRKHYGHRGDGPRLIRGGDLLHDLQVLNLTDAFVEAGTRLRYARVLQDGGTATDAGGRSHEVQAFPFVYFTTQEVDDFMELVRLYYFDDGGAGAS